jgi:tRNA uridine 5-carboxymethylaminomethyl modification enzyme
MVTPTPEVNRELAGGGYAGLKTGTSASALVRRPELTLAALAGMDFVQNRVRLEDYPAEVREQVEIGIKYEGYVERQAQQLAVFDRLESIELPRALDYKSIAGLSIEVVQKMEHHRPDNLGQASRISGITPAAISVLAAVVKSMQKARSQAS